MVRMKPRNPAELKMVIGMGEAKVAKYGRDLLEVIGRHRDGRAA